MIPIILSGCSGSKLWPLSRETYPKQFIQLAGKKSLFQKTLKRLPPTNISEPIIVCNPNHRFIAANQIKELDLDCEAIILDPLDRNTAPAVAITALYLEKQNRDEIMLVLPSDHVILDHHKFFSALKLGEAKVKAGKVVTFGSTPNNPEKEVNYIKTTSKDESGSSIESFIDKPDAQSAQLFMESGHYLWSSGIFMFSSSTYLRELKKHALDIFNASKLAFADILSDSDFQRLNKDSFKCVRAESIENAIMKKTENGYVIPLEAGWNDLEDWSDILDVSIKDKKNNALEGDIFTSDCKGSYLFSENKIVAAVGLENMIVVDTLDAVLVAPKNRSHDVKKIVEELKRKDRPEATIPCLVHRPWGTYESLGKGNRDQVQRIRVYPGQKLSVQLHHKRTEHWVVVRGIASVTVGKRIFDLHENESTYIPLDTIHSIENKTDDTIELIEIRCGDYIGEDDIVRLSDTYGRKITKT
jgi:mannose-1-phosphate guanylyltransferase/mannose-6-phosphate isomerase